VETLRAAGFEGQVGTEYNRNSNLPGTEAPTALEGE
jgi:cytochrome c oxidase subunit 2